MSIEQISPKPPRNPNTTKSVDFTIIFSDYPPWHTLGNALNSMYIIREVAMFTPVVILLLSAASAAPIFAAITVKSIAHYCHHHRSKK